MGEERSNDDARGARSAVAKSGLRKARRRAPPAALIVARHNDAVPMQVRKQRANAVTQKRIDAFFAALADSCNVSMAAKQAGISRSAVWSWRRKDAEFSRRFDMVRADARADLDMRHIGVARDGITGEQWEEVGEDGVRRLCFRRDAPGAMQFQLQRHADAQIDDIDAPARAARETLDELIDRLRAALADIKAAREAGDAGTGQ